MMLCGIDYSPWIPWEAFNEQYSKLDRRKYERKMYAVLKYNVTNPGWDPLWDEDELESLTEGVCIFLIS